MTGRRLLRRALALAAASAGALCAAPPAAAHDGPPYPILVEQPAGAVLLSVWADPDVGTGTFHVYLEPPADGRALPRGCEVEVLVQPVGGRLPERGWRAERFRVSDQRLHLVAEVEFDAVGEWTARFVVRCGGERAEAETVVEVTPPGQGPVLDFVLYLFPFVAVAVLVVRALLRGRIRRPEETPNR